MPVSGPFAALSALASSAGAKVTAVAPTRATALAAAAIAVDTVASVATGSSSVLGSSVSYRVFDVDRLGVMLYFLAIVYAVFFILSIHRNVSITRFSSQAVTEKVLYRAVAVHLAVRTLGFATLSFFNLAGRTKDVWYPLLAILFTFPEQVTISIYAIVFLTWIETFVFAHRQRIAASRARFRSVAWLCFFVVSALQYAVSFVLYFLLAINKDAFDDSVANYIQAQCVSINTLFPLVALAAALVCSRLLRQAPLASPLSRELVHKTTVVFIVWSVGRLVRGVIFILSIAYEWQQRLATNLLGITIISILAFTEFLPLLMLLDWALIGVLLIGDEIIVDPAADADSLTPGVLPEDSSDPADLAALAAAGARGATAGSFGTLNGSDGARSTVALTSSSRAGAGAEAGAGGAGAGGLHAPLLGNDHHDGHGATLRAPVSSQPMAVRLGGADASAGAAAGNPRIDLGMISLPRAFFTGATPAAAAAAAAAGTPVVVGSVGGARGSAEPQVLLDTGVWTTAVGLLEGKRVLVKRFRLEGVRPVSVEELARELDERSRIAHPHVVGFIGVARQGTHVYAVSEYVSRRSLFDLLRQTTRDLSPSAIVRVASEVAAAMEALHARGQVHVHLKSRNVLLDDSMSVRLSDVGVRSVKTFAEVMLGHRFVTAWSAPEVVLGSPPTKASDVYSFGVLCWELVVRQEPFQGLSVAELVEKVGKEGARLRVPTPAELTSRAGAGGALSPLFLTMLGRCFLQPDLRPSFTDIGQMLLRCKKEQGVGN